MFSINSVFFSKFTVSSDLANVRLSQGHTGKYLASELKTCLKDLGIDTKVLHLSCAVNGNTDSLYI